MKQEFTYFWRSAALRRATPIAAALLGAAWLLDAPVAAQETETEAPPNVVVDYGVLDRMGGSAGDDAPLPAPPGKPVSRIVAPGSSGLSAPTPPDVISGGTVLSAPTTPLEATTLGDTVLSEPSDGAADLPGELSAGGAVGSTLPPAPTPPAATESAEAAAMQSASIEPGGTPDASANGVDGTSPLIEGQLRIPYPPDTRAIPEQEKAKIDALIERLQADPSLRLQVLAYAAGDDDEVTRARGLSLARALTLRGYLNEQGIELSRMDVRALGNSAQEEPADRVDLIPLPQ